MSRRAVWTLLVCALIACGAYWWGSQGLPGAGLAVSQWSFLAAAIGCARSAGRCKADATGVALAVLSALLAGCYALYANALMRLMNLPVLAAASVQAALALGGRLEGGSLSVAGLRDGLRQTPGALVRYVGVPLRGMREEGEAAARRGLIWGLALCVPVTGVALVLLCSADSVFGGLVEQGLGAVSVTWVLRAALTLACGLALFSFLYGLTQPASQARAARRPDLPPATLGVPLAALVVLYGLFVYIQIRYLFGGAETALMRGGYAQYARSGFFELVAAAFLSLGMVFAALCLCGRSTAIRWLSALLAAFTAVMTYSSLMRMRLYLEVYGLSLLRLLTLWGMGLIAAGIALALVKCARPALRAAPTLLLLALAGWVALNALNPALLAARYNVSMFNRGALAELDLSYLSAQSPDVLPALEDIADGALRQEALDTALRDWRSRAPSLYDASLSWLRLPAP